MNKLILAVLALAGLASAQISALSLPHTLDSATIPKVSYVDDNDVALRNRLNIVIDSVNGDSIMTLLRSNSSLRLTIDADNNATGTCFAVTHNGATDTIAKFCDDLSARNFGALTISGTLTGAASSFTNGTYSGTLGVTGAFTGTTGALSSTLAVSGASTLVGDLTVGNGGTGSTVTVRGATATTAGYQIYTGSSLRWFMYKGSATESGSDAGAPFRIGAYTDAAAFIDNPIEIVRAAGGAITLARPVTHSSTLTQTGAATFATNITQSAGTTAFTVDDNTATAWEVQQGSNEYLKVVTTNSSENVAIGNATTNPSYSILGSGAVTVGSLAGTGTRVATTTSTGVLGNATTIAGANTWSAAQTFSAAPVVSTLTASLPVFTNGSSALASNAMTGTGSVVMSTSPTLVTPALGAATATSVAATGAVSGVSLATTGGEAFTYGDTSFTITVSTGMTTTPTGTAVGTRVGNVVTLRIPYITGTSNSTQFVLSGIPATWTTSVAQLVPYSGATDNSVPQYTAVAYLMTNSTILLGTPTGGSSGWTNSGTKTTGLTSLSAGCTITYQLQ